MTDEKKLLLAQTIFSIKEEMEKKISGEVTKIHDLYELDFKKIEDLLSEKMYKNEILHLSLPGMFAIRTWRIYL